MLVDYYNFIRVDDETIDRWLLELRDIINSSDNYSWTCNLIDVVNNIESGYFDIEIKGDKHLYIFGIYIEELDDKTYKTLTGSVN